MAVNKRKILEAARKYAQKGARDRALKEYEALLKLDPRDAKLRLEIGDAYRRWGQLDEAIGTYIRVAEQYMAEGFDARAVAVFKQIHNLDPERWPTYEPLAELYQRMGLASDAIHALQTAADGYHRAGRRREALGLLRKMAAIDPSNTASRLKVADLLRQEGLGADAIAEYDGAAEEFERQGELEQAAAALARVLEIDPTRVSALVRIARGLLAAGQADRAEPFARRLLDAEPDVPEHYEVLADVHRMQRREDELTKVYRRLAELYRERGDEEHAREITQRFVAMDGFEAPAAEDDDDPLLEPGMKGDLSQFLEDADTGSDLLLDEDLLDPEPPPATRRALAPAEESGPRGKAKPAPPPVGDPEQLLAEACVYLRYGKRREAIASLEAIAAGEPRHRRALEKLGEARAAAGDTGGAVDAWLRAAGIAQEDGDGPALDLLRDRIAALDQAAAATLGSVAEPALEEEEQYLDISQPVAHAGPDLSLELGAPGESAAADAPPDEIEIEIDADLDDAGAAEDELEESEARDGNRAGSGVAGPGASSSSSRQVAEELEEAEFYLQQGMLDEAEIIYQRLLQVAPNHPQVMVRLGELAAVRGDDPGATGGRRAPEVTAPEEPESAESQELGDWADDLVEPGALGAEADAGVEVGFGEEVAEPEGETWIRPRAGAAAEWTGDVTSELSSPGLEVADAGDTGTLAPERDELSDGLGPEAGGDAGGFDLAAEIHAVLDDEDSVSGGASAGDSFAAVFQEFKRGVSRTLAAGDHEAHYDLGIAYREMGLFDDAMAEFRAAAASPTRRVACLHMLGQCALELGRAEQAVAHLREALASGGLTQDQQLPLRFDLGRAFEVRGDVPQARAAWEAVAAVDPAFADVEERLERLGEEKSDQAPGTAQDFESFDDVLAEGDAAGPDAGGQGIDFADLVAEMNADAAPEPPRPAAAPRSPESRDVAATPLRPRKRKKISFV